jgi:hypothetical protein
MKWTYTEAKNRHFAVQLGYNSRPQCPQADTAGIERAIRQVLLDKRNTLSLAPKTDVFEAATWLPRAKRPKPDMCR